MRKSRKGHLRNFTKDWTNIMPKCNMTFEGKLREHYLRHDGTYSDALVYGIIKKWI